MLFNSEELTLVLCCVLHFTDTSTALQAYHRMVSDHVMPWPSQFAIGKLKSFNFVELWYFTDEGCHKVQDSSRAQSDDVYGLTKIDSVCRSGCMDQKKNRNRTECNREQPDPQLQFPHLGAHSVAGCLKFQILKNRQKTGHNQLQPVF